MRRPRFVSNSAIIIIGVGRRMWWVSYCLSATLSPTAPLEVAPHLCLSHTITLPSLSCSHNMVQWLLIVTLVPSHVLGNQVSSEKCYVNHHIFDAGFEKIVRRGNSLILLLAFTFNAPSGEKVNITGLFKFPTPVAGSINILQRVGPDYKPLLGNILLRSEDGQRIRALEMTHANNVDTVVYDMFQKWISEDENPTWGALVLHLQHASLRTLARDIESVLI